MQINDFHELVNNVGLGHHWNDLKRIVSPSILLTSIPIKEGEELPIGISKLGGLPDLPAGMQWPEKDGILLEFIGQFRLDELASYDDDKQLPDSGMLYFFFDGMLTDYIKGKTPDRCKVIRYFAVDDSLSRLEPPDERPWQFSIYTPCKVKLDRKLTLPPSEEVCGSFFPVISPIDFSLDDARLYTQLRRQLMEHDSWLLGHPWELQGGELRYMIVKKCDIEGRYKYEDYNFKNYDELAKEMKSWRLLFQVGTDQNTGMSWGDGGIVYFWIREEDLYAQRFDQVEAIIQGG
jgi:hypothetical protein